MTQTHPTYPTLRDQAYHLTTIAHPCSNTLHTHPFAFGAPFTTHQLFPPPMPDLRSDATPSASWSSSTQQAHVVVVVEVVVVIVLVIAVIVVAVVVVVRVVIVASW
jgi:hypothetical protein